MISSPVYALDLKTELDVFTARQAGREVAAAVGVRGADLVRVATAVSEIGRDLVLAGGGTATFVVRPPDELTIELRSFLPAPELMARRPTTGVLAAQRLVDSFSLEADTEGRAVIVIGKRVQRIATLTEQARGALRDRVSALLQNPIDELRTQNRELVAALDAEQARRDELAALNQELQETNLGVLALYDELSGEMETTNQGVVALYAEIDDKNRQLRAASEAKTSFLRNISHELRTPANSVLGLTRLLLDEGADPLSQEQGEQVQFIAASAHDLVRLVNELLDLAKAESGRLQTVLADVDLDTVFAELRGTTAPLIVRPGVSLRVEPPGLGRPLQTDRTLLGHILRNLLGNAIKFTEDGEVRLSCTADDDGVQIVVRDTGIGIAPDDQPRVFEEFFQARTALHAKTKGTGLGLPYARRVALHLGGDLTLESSPGVGSCFCLTLPWASAAS